MKNLLFFFMVGVGVSVDVQGTTCVVNNKTPFAVTVKWQLGAPCNEPPMQLIKGQSQAIDIGTCALYQVEVISAEEGTALLYAQPPLEDALAGVKQIVIDVIYDGSPKKLRLELRAVR